MRWRLGPPLRRTLRHSLPAPLVWHSSRQSVSRSKNSTAHARSTHPSQHPLKCVELTTELRPNGRSGSRVTRRLKLVESSKTAGPMHEGGYTMGPRARERSTGDENRSVLSRSQPGRLRSFTYPVRALHFDAGAGFRDVSDRGLTAKGAAPVAALFY